MLLVEFLSSFLHRYVVVCVALAIIPLKLVMVRLAKDPAAEISTFLSIPEDLCYVTLGLLISTLSADISPLRKFFSGSPYPRTDGAILLFGNFVLAFLLHKMTSSLAVPQFQNWRAAMEVRVNHSRLEINGGLTLRAEEDNLLFIFLHHFLKLLFTLLTEFVLTGIWLIYIARVYVLS